MPFYELNTPAWIYGTYYPASKDNKIVLELPEWCASEDWDEVEGPATMASPDMPEEPPTERDKRVEGRGIRLKDKDKDKGKSKTAEKGEGTMTTPQNPQNPKTGEKPGQQNPQNPGQQHPGQKSPSDEKSYSEMQKDREKAQEGHKGGAYDPDPDRKKK